MADCERPNVVIMYADDLGYGDLSCYGGVGVDTPHVDALLENGIQFEDGYSASAVCTPARYSLLTGAYPFRNPFTHILPGNAACIIGKDQPTLPKIFKQAGYHTGVVGKWHLGLGTGEIDWNKDIDCTPNDIGFDYSFIFPATADRVPCVYLKNRRVENLDPDDPLEVSYAKENPFGDVLTAREHPELLKLRYSHGHDMSIVNGVGRIGYMRGGTSALWRDEDLAGRFLSEAENFVRENKEEPFFLYYALHEPHVPRVPNEKFVGASGLGPRGDVIAEMDDCVGRMVAFLEEEGVLDHTIIIFSSDNGPVLDDGYDDRAEFKNRTAGHKPAGPLRGGKYSQYEGGTRVPFIVSWKSHIRPMVSHALVSQLDLAASFAGMLNVPLGDGYPDSMDIMDALLGKSAEGRTEILAEAENKSHFIRQGKWTYMQPSKGNTYELATNSELGYSRDQRLYNMAYDPGQRDDVAMLHREMADRMDARIEEIKKSEKTRP